jgi:hypothetical protein
VAYANPEDRKTSINMHAQSWNVERNQGDGGIVASITKMPRTASAKTRFPDFHISVISRRLMPCLAYMYKPTEMKSLKNMLFKTSTTQNSFPLRINDIRGDRGLATKPESPLESIKGAKTPEIIKKNAKAGTSSGISEMSLI